MLIATSCLFFLSACRSKKATVSHHPNKVITKTYHIAHQGQRLYGKLTAPANYTKRQLPLVIIAHGFNNTLEMYEDYALHLARQGYLVYRFDFFGGSRHSKSGGQDMLKMSILTEEDDLKTVVSALKQEKFVDPKKITLLGASQGGVVASLYAADHPQDVARLILLFPAYVLFDDVKETYAKLHVNDPAKIPPVITHRNARLGALYLQDALKIDLEQKLTQVKAKTLIIHGTADQVVPYTYATKATTMLKNAQLVTVPDGEHYLNARFDRIALPAIDRFLQK